MFTAARAFPEGLAPQRIVSLVPSWTEALFALGLGDRVVGRTEWCTQPLGLDGAVETIGGTKTVDVAAVAALRPDLVIANKEENRRRHIEALEGQHGIRVWLTYPQTVAAGVEDFAAMARLIAGEGEGEGEGGRALQQVVMPSAWAVIAAEEAARSLPAEHRPSVFCPIWREPWMAVGSGTYADDMIALCGGRNAFAAGWAGEDAAAGKAEKRYPKLSLDMIVAAAPDVVLLPDEPYVFGEADREELLALPIPAARSGRIHLVAGSLLTWYGPQVKCAIDTIRPLCAPTTDR
jgi:ABC-type hemin transport system substrate-binding protein